MGDFQVHRARLFAFVPSGVRCLAAPGARPPRRRLAAARLDGAVELYDLQANGAQEKVIPGHEARAPEALCWAAGERLFGAGLGGAVLEYDLQRLRVRAALEAFGGPLWSLAADPEGARLAVGCEDGSVKLFRVEADGIQFERQLDRQKERILSLSWHPSGTKIAAGSIDCFYIFDVESGHTSQRILVEGRLQGPPQERCLVWGLAFLSDGTVVSVDSAGKVQFWDSAMGTLLSKHPISKAAVLSVAVAEVEDSMVVGTSEGAVYQFQLLPVRLGSSERQWVRTRPFWHHTHDVRTVAHTATAFISGGLDGQLVIRPLMERVESKSYDAALRTITFPHRRLVSCSRTARLLLFQYPQHLELWRLGTTNVFGRPGEVLPVSSPPQNLLQLKAKGPEHIRSSCLSPCGAWIVYSTASRFCLHRVQLDNDHISISRVRKIPRLKGSAHHVLFSGDSTRLFLASDRGCVHVLSLLQSGACRHLCTLRPNSETLEAVLQLAVSPDSRWLCAAGGDREICVYNLESPKLHCTVPAYECPVTAMAIHPLTNNLLIAHSDQQVFEFSIPERGYTPWSRKLQQLGLHRDWLERDTPITHIAFRPGDPSHVLLHDTYMFCILDMSLPLQEDSAAYKKSDPHVKTIQLGGGGGGRAFKICKKFQPLLFVDFLDDTSLVVMERPLMDIKAQLPPPLYQKKFGT
ncbi:LOW QUALITY PROTEIN: U3 small nucleolar RNA-associated protein 4 homolog [Erythrolamprus reginae]|uniref:LOW QUALITY PROTEIN: U3 small nucleolar RNA-associated protein 4 homolog n=1 Tax=Erythrolamprus reginae TaxID=121349 RepID=UPI00396C7B41